MERKQYITAVKEKIDESKVQGILSGTEIILEECLESGEVTRKEIKGTFTALADAIGSAMHPVSVLTKDGKYLLLADEGEPVLCSDPEYLMFVKMALNNRLRKVEACCTHSGS